MKSEQTLSASPLAPPVAYLAALDRLAGAIVEARALA
jgi:hypothetical protein